jgi:hypothetical protein
MFVKRSYWMITHHKSSKINFWCFGADSMIGLGWFEQ